MSLQDRLKRAQTSHFVGRVEQLDIFLNNITAEIPVYPFLLISGQGGVGKSTLLDQFQALCRENNVPQARTDATESTPAAAMNQLAIILEKEEYTLNSFRALYQKYLQLKELIQKDPDKPDAFGQIFSRLAGKSVVVVGRSIPLANVALDMIGSDIVEDRVAALSNYLFQKFKHKDDVQLLLDPTAELTPLFVADLNKIAKQRQVVLLFDTFEETQATFLTWLMTLFEGRFGEVSENISFVFAGRSFDEHDWLPVASLLVQCNLEPFTKQETTLYLKKQGIINHKEVDDIYHLSGGLPVHVAMLATSGGTSDGKASRTVVKRFLRNIDNSINRQAVLYVALSRQFDRDVLSHLFASKIDPQQIDSLFSWLIELPFVQSRIGHWIYHPVVRTQIIAYQRNESMNEFTEKHQRLAEYYYSRAERAGRFSGDKWQDLKWWSYYVEATYHALCTNPRENLAKTKQEIADVILEVDSATIFPWLSALRQAATDLGDYEPAIQLAALVETGISAIETSKWDEAFKLFDIFDLLNSEPRNLDFEEGISVLQIPVGWAAKGKNFQFGIDADDIRRGQHSGFLKSSTANLNESGSLTQIIRADKYLGQRVHFSGYAKSKEVEEWAGLFMRIDGRTSDSLNFDDMRDRCITGTTAWQKYDIVIDIPKEGSRIAFGSQLWGKGQFWIADLSFEIVGGNMPTTGSRKEPQNLDFGGDTIGIEQLPMSWKRTGSHFQDYIIGVDRSETYQGKVSACLKSRTTAPEGFGALLQIFQGDHYIGQRLRMSANVKSREVKEWAGLFLRVDGIDDRESLGFENMYNSPIKGTTDWQRYQIVLDVPAEAIAIAFGFLMEGKGQMWVNDFQLEVVSKDVPTTTYISSEPINLDFEIALTGKYPEGWSLFGSRPEDYIIGVDNEVIFDGVSSGFLKSIADKIDGFGCLGQGFSSETYRNQRLRMSAYVKSNNVEDWAGLWMRVDGPKNRYSLSFDNMQDRPIKGTTEWQKYEIVLDVPQESASIWFGVILISTGKVWVDDFKFEVVSRDVPVTGSPEQAISILTKAIQLNSRDASAFYRRAQAFIDAKKYEEALGDCSEAIRLNPKYAEAYQYRGWIYRTQGKYNQSVRDYKKSIRLNPKNAQIFYDLASAYALQKNLKETLTALRRCLKIDKHRYLLNQIPEDANFDFVRNDPRFHALLIEFSETS